MKITHLRNWKQNSRSTSIGKNPLFLKALVFSSIKQEIWGGFLGNVGVGIYSSLCCYRIEILKMCQDFGAIR